MTHMAHGDETTPDDARLKRAVTPKPKPERKPKGKGRRSVLEQQITDIHHLIVFWRDGCQCVERELDGAHCGGEPQWGHVVPQGQSAYLRWNLSNVFCQCRNHNGIHTRDAGTYDLWYVRTWGQTAFDKLQTLKLINQKGHKFYVDDLEEMLADLTRLYENRYLFTNATREQLVAAGWYGQIIRIAWQDDGRLEKAEAV